ncbi:hypothetical protein TH53_06825 [Pedobacter lusitanus]|uniref:Uncharacterized protein n=1 Tax=Pedobacter lusitanus TaxID=1503925 RepID=A0A0D0GU10_9SPHI|nr:SDR family oxidoreductase [Pedobacter lusitanus]KIO77846.1 hypothetical protein TH53_06825 [Pedobacter lusitanus]
MPTVFITGTGQGLGKALTETYYGAGWNVIATCKEVTDVQHLKSLFPDANVYLLDVTNHGQIQQLKLALQGQPIDLLIHNAAWIVKEGSYTEIDYSVWEKAMGVNAFAVLKITTSLLDNIFLAKTGKIVCISSEMGSLSQNSDGGRYCYRASKAAANMIIRNLSIELLSENIIAVSLHPGWIKTRLGGQDAPMSALDSSKHIFTFISGLKPEDTGKFFRYTGELIDW